MRLVMTMVVRNEHDVVDTNLGYHLAQGVDAIVVTDHGSTDGSREILERRSLEAPDQVIVFDEPYEWSARGEWSEQQSRFSTRMARFAHRELAADWVINADADEFYWPNQASLKDVLEAVPSRYGALTAPMATFVLRPDDAELFAHRMVARKVLTFKPAGISVQTNEIHRARSDVVVSSGNHRAHGSGLQLVPSWWPITALHYPYRSEAQLEQKVKWKRDRAEWKREDPDRALELRLVDDEALAKGIREGRLLIDRRLSDFLTAGESDSDPVRPMGGELAWPELPPRVAELRADLERSAWIHDKTERRAAAQQAELEAIRESTWWRLGKALERPRVLVSRARETRGDRAENGESGGP